MKKIRILLLMLAVAGCVVECAGCAAKKPASEQGELVRNERLLEKSGSLS